MLENDFEVKKKCASCKGPLDPDQNWTCIRAIVAIFGGVGEIIIHQHIHIGCAEGDMKWLALRSMCMPVAGDN